MSDRNIIILGGAALLVIMFTVFVFGRSGKEEAALQNIQRQQTTQAVPQAQVTEMTVDLSPQGGSGEQGVAVLNEVNGRVTVNIYLTGYTASVGQPAHIHAGTCPGVGAIRYPLNSVLNGRSTTVLNTSLAQLGGELPLAINVHKSNTEIATYTSCGSL